MAIADITKPMALDETLQATNGKMDTVVTKLQGIIDALGVDTSVYKAAGNKTCAELVPGLLVASNLGNVYNMTDSGTTTSDFVEGAGKEIHVGDNVAIVDVGTGGSNVYKFDLLAGMVDLTNYIQKSSTAGLVKNDGTIDTSSYATTSQIPDISGKADKVASATNGNLAGLNASGNLTDSGWASDKTTTSASGNPISITGLKSNQLAVNPVITFEPIQDLHGYSNPWPAGGGKNKLPLTVSRLKSENTQGSWSGNVYTQYGVTFTILTDNANNVIGIKVNGTASASNTDFNLYQSLNLPNEDVIISGCPSGGSTSTYRIRLGNSGGSYIGADTGNGVTLGGSNVKSASIYISGSVSNLIFYPMIRLATETDTSFAPYENICPISGYDKIEVLSCGKNIWDDDRATGGNATRNGDKYTNSVADSRNYVFLRILLMNGSTFVRQTIINNNITTAGRYSGVIGVASGEKVTTIIVGHSGGSKDISVTYNLVAPITTPCTLAVGVNVVSANPSTVGGFVMDDIQVEYGQTSTTYEPCNKTTDLSENLPQTVYGGSYNPRTGLFTVTWGYIADLSTLSWARADATNHIFYATVSGMESPTDTSERNKGIMCSAYKPSSSTSITSSMDDKSMLRKDGYIYFRDNDCAQRTDFESAIAGKSLAYKLATPTEIQLTPHEISLLKDYAYVSTNGTSIALDYHNGEIATLGDVAQLGETVNELGNCFVNVEDISSKITMSSSSLQNGVRAYKFGRVIHIFIYTGAVATANTITTLGQVDANLLNSSENICGSLGAQTGNDLGAGSIIIEGSSGNIKLIYSKTTTYSLYASFTYVLP
jgi:hypothetical protein